MDDIVVLGPEGLSVWRGSPEGPGLPTAHTVEGEASGRNRGDGRFARPVEAAPAAAPVRILAADLNGDEWPDLAFLDTDGSLDVLHFTGGDDVS